MQLTHDAKTHAIKNCLKLLYIMWLYSLFTHAHVNMLDKKAYKDTLCKIANTGRQQKNNPEPTLLGQLFFCCCRAKYSQRFPKLYPAKRQGRGVLFLCPLTPFSQGQCLPAVWQQSHFLYLRKKKFNLYRSRRKPF